MQQAKYLKKTISQNADAAIIDVQGLSLLAINITGTFVGTLIFEYTINNTDWYTLSANVIGSATKETGATAAGKWIVSVAGFLKVKVRCSAFTSGSILVAMQAILSNGNFPVSADPAVGTTPVTFKPVASPDYSPLKFKDNGTVTTLLVKNAAGNLLSVRVTNANVAARWLQIHNKATAPVGGDTADDYFLIPAGSVAQPATLELGKDFFQESHYVDTGLGIAISTTATTYTAATNGDHSLSGRYI